MSSVDRVLAVDVGGTKLAAALVGPDGSVAGAAEVATPRVMDAARIAAALTELIADVTGDGRPAAAGLASAGPLDLAAGTVSPVNIAAWRDFPLRDLVRRTLSGVPVVLLGDAVATAVGEHWLGAGRGVAGLLGVVVSTGVGGGFVLDGRPFAGPSGNAGHIGHISVDPNGVPCTCGGRGCVEAIASGPAMVRWAVDHGWSGTDARDLATAARSGDAAARGAFDRGAAALAAGFVTAATLIDLDKVVVGGGVAAAGEVLFDPLARHLAAHPKLSYVNRLRVEPAAFGRRAGLIGAARAALAAADLVPDPPAVRT